MNLITGILSNPIVGLIGYLFSLIAAIIAIVQYSGKTKAQYDVSRMKIEITNLSKKIVTLQSVVNNENKVEQGSKSQYFQDNSGSVNIDNRG